MSFRLGILACVTSAAMCASCAGTDGLPASPSSVSSPSSASSDSSRDAAALSGEDRFEVLGKGGGGKGGGGSTGGGGGSFSLVMLGDANMNGLPNRGDRITFAITSSATSP